MGFCADLKSQVERERDRETDRQRVLASEWVTATETERGGGGVMAFCAELKSQV